MTILEEIIAFKQHETAERRELVPLKKLERSEHFNVPFRSRVIFGARTRSALSLK